ncbi:Transcriptional regulator [Wenxinia marina DSM 24838]|uniref:Transcriptional regulator n=2 Tax=Wenxinia TaxID=653686 RepID=A0A0D0Q3M1_9RHOB|nr:Transcriptional regulator [Wenxinia marina DSM 24838]
MTPLLAPSAGARTSHEAVVEALGQAIVDGRLPPGALLPRDEQLIESYGVSRTVLREAMKTLAAKGMIEPRARVGTRVRPRTDWTMFDAQLLRWHLEASPTPAFLGALFEMRGAFEPFAAGLAARHADAAAVGEMRAEVARMRAAEDQTAFARADLQLHRTILSATENPFFHSLGSLIEAALLTVLRLSSPVGHPDRQAEVCAQHDRIVDAIARGDAVGAEAAMAGVIGSGRDRIADEWEEADA